MAKIQQGDYLKATPSIADTSNALDIVGAFNNTLNTTYDAAQKANASKIANNAIDLSNRALALNNDINIKYQADPTNPEREREFRESFELLAAEYKVNPLIEGQWAITKDKIYNNYSTYNAKWQIKQQQENATNDLKNGYEALNEKISMLGKNGANYDEVRLVYENGISGLRNAAVTSLGEIVTENFLKDAKHDFMTSYIGSLAMDNPLKAQALMKDDGVLNDIGNAQTIEKLNDYINKSMLNQHKKSAVAELGNALRAMRSDEAEDLLKGRANINQLMKFNENFKHLQQESKDMLYGIYGIKSQNKYAYDGDSKSIVRTKDGSGESLSNLKLTDVQKRVLADELETGLQTLLFNPDDVINVKDLKSTEQKEQAHNRQIATMKAIATMQGRIDSAVATGAITKEERKQYIQKYIAPASDFVEQNLQQLDEGSWNGKNLLGYDRIKKEFDTTDLKGKDLQDVQQQKLMAQSYYLDELHQVVQNTPGLNSIYDIETKITSRENRRKIYEIAADNALLKAKRWTSKPEIFFQKEFPAQYELPFKVFGQEKAMQINREVASKVYKDMYESSGRELDIKKLVNDKSYEAIKREALRGARKAGDILLRDIESSMHNPLPKNYVELKNEIENMGWNINQFRDFAYENGYVDNLNSAMHGFMSSGYMNALKDLRRINSMKNK